jgi:hypothetical protein
MAWWDFAINSFIANFVPSDKIPYKMHVKNIVNQLVKALKILLLNSK